MNSKRLKTTFELAIVFFLLLAVGATLYVAQNRQILENRASGTSAVPLTIDLANSRPLIRIWQNLSQGGEIPLPQLPAVSSQMRQLSLSYVRLDHIFDAYQVVKRNSSGQLVYNFSLLDQEVDAILQAGAKPFLSLSYVTDDIADPGNKDRPTYSFWEDAIAQTVAHYSGKNGKNIDQVFYEVYNEPDLFGKWNPDEYFTLYQSSVQAAESVKNANTYAIGGPAITSFKKDFMSTFLTMAAKDNLRLDFISWHVYERSPLRIGQDIEKLAAMLTDKPMYQNSAIVISEWGSFPEKHIWHDTVFDSSHLVATVAKSLVYQPKLFHFEVKDGVDPGGQKYFGGWGILTNEKTGLTKKPRFYALSLLNKLKALQFPVAPDNEHIYAIASGNSSSDLTIVITYYTFGQDSLPIATPIRFVNIPPGVYEVQKTVLEAREEPRVEDPIRFSPTKGDRAIALEMKSDSVAALDLKRIAATDDLTVGEKGEGDNAAKISTASGSLMYPIATASAAIPGKTDVSFSFKPDVPISQPSDVIFFDSSDGVSGTSVQLSGKTQDSNSVLTLIVSDAKGITSTQSIPIPVDTYNQWHSVQLLFDNNRALLSLTLDGKVAFGALNSQVKLGQNISFGGTLLNQTLLNGAIDNIAVSVDDHPILTDNF